jgi:hypothetical protein
MGEPRNRSSARTAMLMWIEGPAAFGPASLALMRFTGGPVAAATLAMFSLLLWAVAPLVVAARRLSLADV